MHSLFARHRTSVYRWLLRFVRDQAAAEDLLSEVFLDVWQQADQFEGRSSVSTWLMSIARFKALSAGRRRTDAALDETIEATVADPANDPESTLQEKDRGELLRQALIQLSLEHRQIIDLVYYHEKIPLTKATSSTTAPWPGRHLAWISPSSEIRTACF